jgi:hypothetical protein
MGYQRCGDRAMKQKLTNSQIKIVNKVFPDVDLQIFIYRVEKSELSHAEIDEACLALNDEYLLNGIDEEFEATDYGKEIEDLIDIVNRPRLT